MDSPPLSIGLSWSQGFPSSDDSGLLLMSGFSGSSISSEDSAPSNLNMEVQESDEDSATVLHESNGMSCEDFNTLKKVPEWQLEKTVSPPPEFQDGPSLRKFVLIEKFAKVFVSDVINEALASQFTWAIECSQECHPSAFYSTSSRRKGSSGPRLCWTPEIPFSPCHHRSGSSLASSRLSISHNSLTIPRGKVDDSSFITLAMSHDLLLGEMSEIYNVPIESDIYTLPVDTVAQENGERKQKRKVHRKKRRHTSSSSEAGHSTTGAGRRARRSGRQSVTRASAETLEGGGKRHSMPASSRRPGPSNSETTSRAKEPVHMTLQEVRQYLQTLYSSSSDSTELRPSSEPKMPALPPPATPQPNRTTPTLKKSNFSLSGIRMKKSKSVDEKATARKCGSGFSNSIKQTLCSLFRFRKVESEKPSPQSKANKERVIRQPPTPSGSVVLESIANGLDSAARPNFSHRALPPLPPSSLNNNNDDQMHALEIDEQEIQLLRIKEDADDLPEQEEEPIEENIAFASSIQKVKDYGWYWGPISGEAAEKVLSAEPDGSFIVRDSSDQHYIFSLSFRLNGNVRHVRIEHDQGNFSFGSCTKFKSHTIVEFIENAVEHSRSGRYLFFLHRRPVLGPMRVQLLHPVSRFKQVSSLKHMCRFVILKLVRKDMIPELPLPRRVIEYLNTPHYYVEQQLEEENSGSSGSDLLSFVPHQPLS